MTDKPTFVPTVSTDEARREQVEAAIAQNYRDNAPHQKRTLDFTDDPVWMDAKYIVFKREDFERTIYGDIAPRYAGLEIKDAVVIRRQDLFAASCLAQYSASIAIAISVMDAKDPRRQQLLDIADYFEQQAKLAAEEGHKLPDM